MNVMLGHREERALSKLDTQGQACGVLRDRGVHLRALRNLRRLGLAEDDPTTKSEMKRWRLTADGEVRRAASAKALRESEISQ